VNGSLGSAYLAAGSPAVDIGGRVGEEPRPYRVTSAAGQADTVKVDLRYRYPAPRHLLLRLKLGWAEGNMYARE
jgi:hypothetical protein